MVTTLPPGSYDLLGQVKTSLPEADLDRETTVSPF